MKLSYWLIKHAADDSKSIRGRTRREVELTHARLDATGEVSSSDFEAPIKIVAEYKDGFELMVRIRSGELQETAAPKHKKGQEGEQKHHPARI